MEMKKMRRTGWILTHMGVLLVFLLGGVLLCIEKTEQVPVYYDRDIVSGAGIRIHLQSFRMTEDADEYVGVLTFTSPEGEKFTKELRVNHPIYVHGHKYYLDSYGWLALLRMQNMRTGIESQAYVTEETFLEVAEQGTGLYCSSIGVNNTDEKVQENIESTGGAGDQMGITYAVIGEQGSTNIGWLGIGETLPVDQVVFALEAVEAYPVISIKETSEAMLAALYISFGITILGLWLCMFYESVCLCLKKKRNREFVSAENPSKTHPLKKGIWRAVDITAAILAGYMLLRGMFLGRLPLTTRFEFTIVFACAILLLLILLRKIVPTEWVAKIAMLGVFALLLYAMWLPKKFTILVPALKSSWLGVHIVSAAISYACFAVAACGEIVCLIAERKTESKKEMSGKHLEQISSSLIKTGLFLLTIVIFSGCIWAEQTWMSFWSWDPKETWALVTWIIYTIYLHIGRICNREQMAKLAVIAFACVIFTFVGVNHLLPGLHSYG